MQPSELSEPQTPVHGGDSNLLTLHVAEYQALMTRCNYFIALHLGIWSIVVTIALFAAQRWLADGNPTILWLAGLGIQGLLQLWTTVLEEHGARGRGRTFMVYPAGGKLHLPSDLAGLTGISYESGSDNNLQAALALPCIRIKEVMDVGQALAGASPVSNANPERSAPRGPATAAWKSTGDCP